jgi:hypothetical protein
VFSLRKHTSDGSDSSDVEGSPSYGVENPQLARTQPWRPSLFTS